MNDQVTKPKRGRPIKHPRDMIDTKQLLIRCGVEAMTERGYMTSDIDSILKKTKVPKGSFYYYFDSKETFGHEILNSYASYFAHKLDQCLNNPEILPLDRIYAFYYSAKQGMEKYQFKRGCLVGNLGQEITTLPESYRVRLNEILINWQNQIVDCLNDAQMMGQIAKTADCQMLAIFFWIGWEGAVMRAKLVKSAQPLTIFIEGFIAGLPR